MLGVLLDIPNYDFIPRGGFADTLFHRTFIEFAIAGFPNPPFSITLIGLVILTIIAVAVNGITEKLTGKKVGGMFAAIVFTIIGSALAVAFVRLPFDFALEGVRIIAALLGAIVISVFYSLIRGSVSGKGGH